MGPPPQKKQRHELGHERVIEARSCPTIPKKSQATKSNAWTSQAGALRSRRLSKLKLIKLPRWAQAKLRTTSPGRTTPEFDRDSH